jgi:uncharacterized membrane protein YkvA (DUF1232 family)
LQLIAEGDEQWYETPRVKLTEWCETIEGLTYAYPDVLMMLPNFGITLIRLVNDPRVLTERKVFLAAVIANVASPIDLMPEAYLGPSRIADEVVVAVFALQQALDKGESELVQNHLTGEGIVADAVEHALGAADRVVGKKQ